MKASTDAATAAAAAAEIDDLAVAIIRHARRPRCLPPQDTYTGVVTSPQIGPAPPKSRSSPPVNPRGHLAGGSTLSTRHTHMQRWSSRTSKPREQFDPTPISSTHMNAVLAEHPYKSPSAITAEEAEEAMKRKEQARAANAEAEVAAAAERAAIEASTPRPLPFSLPARDRAVQPLLLTLSASGSSSGALLSPSSCERSRRKATMPRRAGRAEMPSENLRPWVDADEPIEVVSEFTGIGGLEHGLEAGFAEAGLELLLVQASELDSTSSGRHASAVLRKRFPTCSVLNPSHRTAQPYPPSVRMCDVTAQCTQHSGLNVFGKPEETEAMLDDVLARLGAAPGVEVVFFENVANFLRVLDSQHRSSYAYWVEGLEAAGFVEHAYVVLPTAVCGDHHHRKRLLSVHTRGAFHPVGALLRLLVDSAEAAHELEAACERSHVLAFTTGASETRAHAKGGMNAVRGKLPAYNQSLNVALFADGSYHRLSPPLAARCSGLPEAYQDVNSKRGFLDGEAIAASATDAAIALANMVSSRASPSDGHPIDAPDCHPFAFPIAIRLPSELPPNWPPFVTRAAIQLLTMLPSVAPSASAGEPRAGTRARPCARFRVAAAEKPLRAARPRQRADPHGRGRVGVASRRIPARTPQAVAPGDAVLHAPNERPLAPTARELVLAGGAAPSEWPLVAADDRRWPTMAAGGRWWPLVAAGDRW